MNRRCTSEVCLATATGRSASLDLSMSQVLLEPRQDWRRLTAGRTRVAREIEVDWDSFNQDQYIFSHCTIVASVNHEDNGYYIDPVCSPLVNNNGNAWTNPVLLATFRSFVGGENYLEHVQIPELSKGKILDAVIRPIRYKNAQTGTDAPVYYTDILVATDRRHDKLCRRIASGELGTMSMGCFVSGTPVLMADGTSKPVEDIVVGERVLTHRGNVAEVESTRVRPTGDGELRRVSIQGAPDTFVTKEHPYWTLVGKDRCAGCGGEMERPSPSNGLKGFMRDWCSSSCYQTHCNTNPKVAVLERAEVEQKVKFDWVAVKDLRVGDYVAIPLGRPEMERSAIPTASCRLLGFYAAEGNLQRRPDGTPRAVEFTFGFKESCADDVERCLREWGLPSEKIYRQDRQRKGASSTRIVAHSDELAKWLLQSVGEHCDEKRFSEWILRLDDESVLQVLGAYVDGDGHCRADAARVSTTSTSRKLTEQVWAMMISVGVPCSFGGPHVKKGRKPSWSVYVRKGRAGRLVSSSEKVVQQPDVKDRTSEFEGHMLRKVTKNEEVRGTYFVHNLHVSSDDHSYFANMLPVHNCLANWVQCSRCGVVLGDNDPNCRHIDHELRQEFQDENGITRIVAELCGRSFRDASGAWVGDPGSLRFIEASWVERPAFEGAVLNHFLSEIPKASAKILEFPTHKLEQTMEELFRTRVADSRGMMVLRVAIEEMNRRRRESMASRVAKSFWS